MTIYASSCQNINIVKLNIAYDGRITHIGRHLDNSEQVLVTRIANQCVYNNSYLTLSICT